MNSILVDSGRIFIDGRETVDPTLIGYAIIDLVHDEKVINHIQPKQKTENKTLKSNYFEFLKSNRMRLTEERKIMIDIVSKMNDFNAYDIMEKAKELNFKISLATIYNFLDTCVEYKIIDMKPKTYAFNSNS